MNRGLLTIAITVTLALAGVVGATTAAGKSRSKACPTLDGRISVGKKVKRGAVAPGIKIASASKKRVVVKVLSGFRLDKVCVKAGKSFKRYKIDQKLPVNGAVTVKISKLRKGPKLSQISFDTRPSGATCETFKPLDVSFGEPITIDPNRAGGEPVSVVAPDGSISVSAHAGTTHLYKDPTAAPGAGDFVVGYYNQTLNWRSTDGGKTWTYIGFANTGHGPHSATSTGFSDPDFAMDQAGNIYNTEINLANVSVFKSTDYGQSYPIANPVAWSGDRPWLTGLEPDEVFLYVNLPKALLRSTDPNLLVWERLPVPPVDSKLMPDPRNPDDGLIGPVGLGRFAISGDDAQTWTEYEFGPLGPSVQFFGVVGVDRVGHVYQAAAGGYDGPGDEDPSGSVTYSFYDRDTGQTNTEELNIDIPSGDALWPWIIAGDDGRVAIIWYQNFAAEPRKFYAYVAVTNNARGTTLKCSDGTTKYVAPQWDVENASKRPIHVGDICLAGTACNAATTFDGGDRRLGDFYTVNYDLDGNVIIATADTTATNPFEGPKPVGNPIFVKQSSGPGLLERPIPPKPMR